MKKIIMDGYEDQVIVWVRTNFKELGYDAILDTNTQSTPDFVMLKNSKKTKVEVETHSGHFFSHNHKAEDVDEVLCVVIDKKLPVKTIMLNQLIMWYDLPDNALLNFFKNNSDRMLKNNRTNGIFWHFQDTWFYVDKLYHEYGLCERCDYNLPTWANFCFVCGAHHEAHGQFVLNIPFKYKSCAKCDFSIPIRAKYCTKCGERQNGV